MSSPPLRLKLDRIAELVLDRPGKQNAMNEAMGDAIVDAVARVNADVGVRVLLVRGEGRAFSAGGDFDVLEANAGRTPEENRLGMLAFYRRYLSVLRVRVPTIAVLHGAAVGAGLCFAMACDLRLAASEAKLGVNFVRVGLHPGMGCTVLLPRWVGAARATELMLTGRLFDGAEAERIGLVTRAVPRADLEDTVQRTAESIASAAPIAVAQTKASLAASLFAELDGALDREAACQGIDFATADLRTAVAAFREGRAPDFQGR